MKEWRRGKKKWSGNIYLFRHFGREPSSIIEKQVVGYIGMSNIAGPFGPVDIVEKTRATGWRARRVSRHPAGR